MRAAMLCHLFVAAALATAQPPPPIPMAADGRPAVVRTGDALTVPPGKFADVTVDVPAGASVVWRFYPPPVQRADKLPPGRAIFAGEPGKVYVVTSIVVDFKKQTVTDTEFTVTFGGKAEPKPDDPLPPPKPKPDVKPEPVTSFHVVVVYESGATYDAKVAGVIHSGFIRSYLDAETTPDAGTKGWRLRDKDLSADNDTPFQKSLWAAIKPQITTIPCWAVEVNGKVEIVPLPATVADGLALLRRYKEGK